MLSHSILSAIYLEPHKADGSSWWGDLPERAPHSAWHTLSSFQNLTLLVSSFHAGCSFSAPCASPITSWTPSVQAPDSAFGPRSTSILSPGDLSQPRALAIMRTPEVLPAPRHQSHKPIWTSLGFSKLKWHFTPFSPSSIQTKTTKFSAPSTAPFP